MGAGSNVFNFVSCIPFVCCLVIYKPNCTVLFWGEWRNKCHITGVLGTAYRLKGYRFHQIIRLCGFKYRPALWGGKNCCSWGWGDVHSALLGTVGQAQAIAAGDRQPDQDLFGLNSRGDYVYKSIWESWKACQGCAFEINLPNSHPQHSHTIQFASQCGFKQCIQLPLTFSQSRCALGAGSDQS